MFGQESGVRMGDVYGGHVVVPAGARARPPERAARAPARERGTLLCARRHSRRPTHRRDRKAR